MCRKCNTESRAFKEALTKAGNLTEGRIKYGVYTRTFPNGENYPFVKKVTAIKKDDTICCYYLPDGTKLEKNV